MKFIDSAFIIILVALAAFTPDSLSGAESRVMVKIAVEHSGIHIISHEQLQACGLNQADRLAVYGYGGIIPPSPDDDNDRLPEVPTMVTQDGSLIFYAVGPEQYHIEANSTTSQVYTHIKCNSCTRYGYYFIAPADAPLRIRHHDGVTPSGKIINDHFSSAVYHPQLSNPARAGVTFLGDDFSKTADKSLTINFETPGITTSSNLWLRLRGGIKATSPRINYSFNTSSKLLPCTSSQPSFYEIEKYYSPTDFMQSAFRQLNSHPQVQILKASLPLSGKVSYAAIESATLTYKRYNEMPADGHQLSMLEWDIASGDALMFNRSHSNVTVWDVTDPGNPVSLPITDSSTDNSTMALVTDSHSGSSHFIAFETDSDKLPSVKIVSTVSIGHLYGMPVPDMVIVSAPDFINQALRLAALHNRYQQYDVTVVATDDIYDHYGSGAHSPYAIKHFITDLYFRDSEKFGNLLIFGTATWDPRHIIAGNSNDANSVVTWQTEDFEAQSDASLCYASDAFYGILNEDGMPFELMHRLPMSINVGRIPAISVSQAKAYIDKVEQYLASPPATDIHSHALVIGDHGDDNLHLRQAMLLCDSIELRWAPNTIVTRALSALYEKKNSSTPLLLDKVERSLDSGVGFVSYIGHSNIQNMLSDETLTGSFMAALTNEVHPLAMLSTCYATGFDRQENTIGERMLFNPQGGAIAIIGASRAVKSTHNHTLNMSIGREYFTATGHVTMGDIFRKARNSVVTSGTNANLSLNTASYNLLGDPLLPLYLPTHSIKPDNDGEPTITPLGENYLRGSIMDSKGNIDTSFNGKIIANLYNPATTAETIYDPTVVKSETITLRDKLAATASGIVKEGRYELNLDCPEVTWDGNGHRLSLLAISTTDASRASILFDNVTVKALESNDDSDGSMHIQELYIGNPDFTDGDPVESPIAVHASIETTATQLSRVNILGRTCYLSIDGKRYNDIANHFIDNGDGITTMDYTVGPIDNGRHSLTLHLSDNAGQHVAKTLSFQTLDNLQPLSLKVEEETATTSATIALEHNLDIEPTGRLLIENAFGTTILSIPDTTFPYTWNLRDTTGAYVPDGRYTARAIVKSPHPAPATTPAVITVIIDDDNKINTHIKD
ncbi:MAG: C25 family cysteine peptidase [Clostridiales bacterium]|nr:C25 family cysteine peptidase [Clostridiales bacterium]